MTSLADRIRARDKMLAQIQQAPACVHTFDIKFDLCHPFTTCDRPVVGAWLIREPESGLWFRYGYAERAKADEQRQNLVEWADEYQVNVDELEPYLWISDPTGVEILL